MRVLLLLVLALALPLAAARSVTLELEAREDGFRLAGATEPNPTLLVEAGDVVTLRFVNRAAAPHNVHFGAPLNLSTPCCQARGDEHELTFTAPDVRGGVPYWSDTDPDRFRGTLLVGEALPRVRIVQPAEGTDVPASFEARVEVENFVLEPFPAGNEPAPGRGHLRFLLDGVNVSTLTHRTTHAFENVPVGHHLLRVELVGRDGAPLDPPASDEVLVYRSPTPTPPPVGTNEPGEPTPTSPTPGAGLLALVAALAIAARSRRPRR